MALKAHYLQDIGTTAREDRQILADAFKPGVSASSHLLVTPSGATRGVSIAVGSGYVNGTNNAGQGLYRVSSDAAATLVHDAASTNPRVDQVVLRVYDETEIGSGPNQATIEIVKGTETSGATLTNLNGAAALPASSLRLAHVLVTVGMGAVPGVGIKDARMPSSGIVTGHVNSAGPSITSGYGFSVAYSSGIYAVTFNTAMATVPHVSYEVPGFVSAALSALPVVGGFQLNVGDPASFSFMANPS